MFPCLFRAFCSFDSCSAQLIHDVIRSLGPCSLVSTMVTIVNDHGMLTGGHALVDTERDSRM